MKKFNFLICYDISDIKRLRQTAKLLESNSIRIQKSIFYCMDSTRDNMINIIKELEQIIDKKYDDVRIYKVDKNMSIHLKSGINLKKPNIIGV